MTSILIGGYDDLMMFVLIDFMLIKNIVRIFNYSQDDFLPLLCNITESARETCVAMLRVGTAGSGRSYCVPKSRVSTVGYCVATSIIVYKKI